MQLTCWYLLHETHVTDDGDALLAVLAGADTSIPGSARPVCTPGIAFPPDPPVDLPERVSSTWGCVTDSPVTAPEWRRSGRYTRAADWYALGQVLYRVCCSEALAAPRPERATPGAVEHEDEVHRQDRAIEWLGWATLTARETAQVERGRPA